MMTCGPLAALTDRRYREVLSRLEAFRGVRGASAVLGRFGAGDTIEALYRR